MKDDIDILLGGVSDKYALPPLPLTEAVISLEHLRHNLATIKTKFGFSRKIIAVVKANAYGHTIEAIIPTLIEEGVDYFGVANINEGILLRHFLERGLGIQTERAPQILAFAAPLFEQIPYYYKHNIEATISGFETLKLLNHFAESRSVTLPVHLKIDTGMGRLGCLPKEAVRIADLIDNSPHLDLKSVYSHLSSAPEDAVYTATQTDLFLSIIESLKKTIHNPFMAHIDNSGGLLFESHSLFDAIRPGITLFGISPDATLSFLGDLKPVMQLQSRVTFTKWVEPGTPISYGRRWISKRHCRIATVSIGYADGLPRALSNKLSVLINGKSFRQVGTITMDQMMVNLDNDATIHEGDEVIIFGWAPGVNRVSDLAQCVDTIPYEILTSVSPRVRRRLLEGGNKLV